jgi:hypothetical protein
LNTGTGTTLDVYSTATAQVVAQVGVPHQGTAFQGVAATSNPYVFVVATGELGACGAHLYSLRLTAYGQSAGYTPLPVPTLPEDVLALAGTPNGQFLAYAGNACSNATVGDIGYINLATRTITRWTAPKQEDIESLSLSANGSEIGFAVEPTQLFSPEAGVIDAFGPTGTVADRAQVIVANGELRPAGTVPEGEVLSLDGRKMYVCGAGVSLGNTPTPTTPDPLLTFSGTTLTHTAHLAGAGSCELSLDPSGSYLLAQTSGGYSNGSTPALQLIDVATGKATTLAVPAANLQQPNVVFW